MIQYTPVELGKKEEASSSKDSPNFQFRKEKMKSLWKGINLNGRSRKCSEDKYKINEK